MPSFLLPLDQAPDDPALVGGKAAGLGRLLRAGLPVPPGFVLTVEAFRAFLQANGLEGELERLAAAQPLEAYDAIRARLRAPRAQWPDELRAAIDAAFASLRAATGGAPVAVRSSATAEDRAEASFAGQHATLLNIRSLEGLLDAVRTCWASLYRPHAREYRRAQAVDDDAPAMAVVVQALVPAQAAGVACTCDPVSGDADVVVIEGAWGLGEGVVSGIVAPDHYTVRKADGAVLRRAVATQQAQVILSPDGGTRTEVIADDRAYQPVLSDAQLGALAQLAARVEELAGAPQDIEWALADGRFCLLQSRPITSASTAPALEEWVSEFDTETSPDTLWTAANVQEVLPDQISPLNLTMTEEIVRRFGDEPIRRLGITLKNPDPFSAYFYGRPFLNVSMMIELADQTPFGSADALIDQFFGQRRPADARPKRPGLRKLLRYAWILPRLIWYGARYPAEIRHAERTIADFEREMAERPFPERSTEELVQTAEEGLVRGGEVGVTHVSGGGITGAMFDWLGRLTRDWLGDEHGALQATLCSGLGSVESAQPAYELWDLSRLVLASPGLRAAFEPSDGAEIERRLAALDGEAGVTFRRRLDDFLTRHGHRSISEAEISALSWEEDAPTVYVMVRNYLHAPESADPRRVEARQRQEREEATRLALRRLSWWRRLVFRYVLAQAQRWVISREHTKDLLVRATHRSRRLTREIARRLVAQGVLDETADFYQLTWEQAQALLRGDLGRDQVEPDIMRRKAEAARNRQVVLPETFQGRPKPLRPADLPLPEGRLLRGMPVSPGRATGPARVILDPRRDAAIEPGEILVAPVTDAGWTPLFITAAGVVVDIGGALSHGSTVAREYGLPAVVNVKHGTRLIRTGQTITVDGTQGVVVLTEAS